MNTNFQFLLGDLEVNNFLDRYYGSSPVLIKGVSEKFGKLFNINDFNGILNNNNIQYPQVRATNHQNTVHKYNLINDKDRYSNNTNNQIDRRKLLVAIAAGATLVFDNIHQHHKSLEDFTDRLAEELGLRIGVNGYYTARNTLGVNVHFDRHDVLALQIHGRKKWYYKSAEHVLSKAIRHQEVPTVDADFSGWNSVTLNQGDMFYCPRGLWHFTQTEDEHSAHLALGLYPLTLKDWLSRAERDPEIAQLLETYVCAPFHDGAESIAADPVVKLLALLEKKAAQPFAYRPIPRPYIELE